MKALNLKFILEAVDKISAPVRKVATRIQESMKTATKAVFEFGDKLDKIGKKAGEIGGFLTGRLTAPILALGVFSIRSAGQVEDLVEQLTPLAGSAEKAAAYVKGLQGYVDRFGQADVSEAVTQLEMAGYNMDQINQRMKLLGDIAAGSRQPLAGLVDQYISFRKNAKLSDGDLEAMQKARIPIVQQLAAQLGKSEKQIINMAANGKIAFKDYRKALEALTAEGGRFAGAMDKRGKTINGQFQQLTNVLSRLAPIGAELWEKLALNQKISRLIDGVDKLTKRFLALPESMKNLIIYGALAVAALGPIVLVVGHIITAVGGLLMVFSRIPAILGGAITVIVNLAKVLRFLWMVFAMNPIGLVITALVALGAAAYLLIKHWDKVKSFFEAVWESIKSAFQSGVAGAMLVLQPLLDAVNTVVDGVGRVANAAGSAFRSGSNWLFGDEGGDGRASVPAVAAPLSRGVSGRVDAGGTIRIQIDQDGRAQVKDAQPNDRRLNYSADTGRLMGGY